MEIEQEHSVTMPLFDKIQSYLTLQFVYLTDEIEEEQWKSKSVYVNMVHFKKNPFFFKFFPIGLGGSA